MFAAEFWFGLLCFVYTRTLQFFCTWEYSWYVGSVCLAILVLLVVFVLIVFELSLRCSWAERVLRHLQAVFDNFFRCYFFVSAFLEIDKVPLLLLIILLLLLYFHKKPARFEPFFLVFVRSINNMNNDAPNVLWLCHFGCHGTCLWHLQRSGVFRLLLRPFKSAGSHMIILRIKEHSLGIICHFNTASKRHSCRLKCCAHAIMLQHFVFEAKTIWPFYGIVCTYLKVRSKLLGENKTKKGTRWWLKCQSKSEKPKF